MNSDTQKTRRSIVFGLGLSGMLGATPSFAQDAFPNKTIRVVVPFLPAPTWTLLQEYLQISYQKKLTNPSLLKINPVLVVHLVGTR